jgi:hypothetical protein
MRKRMVTRTIVSTDVTVICLNIETAEPSDETYTIAGQYEQKDFDKLLKKLKSKYDTDTVKLVSIVSVDKHEEVYGMTEDDFMAQAKKLDDKRKPID